MKVIKEPVPIRWSIEKECIADVHYEDVGCGAILEVESDDIYLHYQKKSCWSETNQEFYNYIAHSFIFKCPCCGNENQIEEKDIPEKIRKIIVNLEREKGTELEYKKKIGYR